MNSFVSFCAKVIFQNVESSVFKVFGRLTLASLQSKDIVAYGDIDWTIYASAFLDNSCHFCSFIF